MTQSSGSRAQACPVLFLDLEGGFGGSSRSMYYLIKHMDREQYPPVVVVRKNGPIVERYREIGIRCHVIADIPSFRPGERKRPVAYTLYWWAMRRFAKVERELRALVEAHGVRAIHVNHESLALTGARLAGRLGLPWACHIRTTLVPSFFARHVYSVVNRAASAIVFITDQNMTHFAALTGKAFAMNKAAVVRNITPGFDGGLEPLPELAGEDGRFRVLSLSNFSPNRGVDRIVDVAAALKARGRADFVFFLYGHAAHKSLLGGSSFAEQIVKRVTDEGLEDMVRFPGHTAAPERALAGAEALIKLTREANPWGRDIMEAMAAGLPVVTQGVYEGFVENGVNGYLELAYDPERIADYLVSLKDEGGKLDAVRAANRAKAERLFSGRANARLVERVYERMLGPAGD